MRQKPWKNDWNPGIWVLIWEYSVRAIQWIPTWHGFEGLQKSLRLCALQESSLSIERVKWNLFQNIYREYQEGSDCSNCQRLHDSHEPNWLQKCIIKQAQNKTQTNNLRVSTECLLQVLKPMTHVGATIRYSWKIGTECAGSLNDTRKIYCSPA